MVSVETELEMEDGVMGGLEHDYDSGHVFR